MTGPLGLGWLLWAGLVAGAAGLAWIAIAALQKRSGGEMARALIVSAAAFAFTDIAVHTGAAWLWWTAGFAACAAAHRWVDAFAPRASAPETVLPSSPSKPKKSKA